MTRSVSWALLAMCLARCLASRGAHAEGVEAEQTRQAWALGVEARRGEEEAFGPVETLELSRDPPSTRLEASGTFFVVVRAPIGRRPTSVDLVSVGSAGAVLDARRAVPLTREECPAPAGADQECARSRPLRLVAAEVDRWHPDLAASGLLARLGGHVRIVAGGGARELVVGGPHELGGAAYDVAVRLRVLRSSQEGAPALYDDEVQTVRAAETALDEASAVFEQCGFALRPARTGEIRVVSPPRAELLHVGCQGGLLASGGQVSLMTARGAVHLTTRPEEHPGSVAVRLAAELRRRGLRVSVAESPRAGPSAGRSYDLLVTTAQGWPGLAAEARAPLSSDPSLGVCLGTLDLADGLSHFEDETAKVGTIEERLLLRGALSSEGDQVGVVIVPYFSGRGRIGESFIAGGGASLQNLVILDRAGLRAGARSSTLAHEMGHVLLAEPGHPDDFGLDQPHRLMDADASDPSAHGPRRLLLEECRRVLREHGPKSAVPLLTPRGGSDAPTRPSALGHQDDQARP